MATLYAYDGRADWGGRFIRAARKAGHKGVLFTDPADVPDGGRAFVRLDQHGRHLDETKGVALALHQRGCIVSVSEDEIAWYDDKVAQHGALHPWIPETTVFRRKADALAFAKTADYPLISKAGPGASAANVRLIETREQAEAEAKAAFSRAGITLRHGRVQRGYVYWQKFVADNPCDYRVLIVGDCFYGAVQDNRPGTVFASGSGLGRVLDLSTEREWQAVALAEEIASTLGLDWTAFDILFDGYRPVVTEMSSSWGIHLTASAPVYRRGTGEPTGQTASAALFGLAVERLLNLPS